MESHLYTMHPSHVVDLFLSMSPSHSLSFFPFTICNLFSVPLSLSLSLSLSHSDSQSSGLSLSLSLVLSHREGARESAREIKRERAKKNICRVHSI